MEQLSPREFGRRTANGRPSGELDYRPFHGHSFQCACGHEHVFRPWMEIIRELPPFRFVVVCPHGEHLTLIEEKRGLLGFVALVPRLGTTLPERRDSRAGIEFQAGLLEAKTGRPWSLEETAVYVEMQRDLAAGEA